MTRAIVAMIFSIGVFAPILGECAGDEAEAGKAVPGMNVYYGPQRAHRVMIRSEEEIIAVLEVPQGVLLGLQARGEGNPPMRDALALPTTFRGDIEIRVRLESEIGSDEESIASEIMAKAPLLLAADDLVVELSPIEEP